MNNALKLALTGLLLFCSTAWATPNTKHDRVLIVEALNNYIQGTSFSNKEQISSAFYRQANLYLEKKAQTLWTVPIAEYLSWYKNENKGVSNGRVGEIISIDIAGHIATAKAEILIPKDNSRFVDMFLLKKLAGKWQILSKSAIRTKSQANAERVLFIVSNAHFHGDSKLPAGVSFSEIVKAYDAFKLAGYTVDMVSPKGGAIPLSYINTSETIHKKYLYNSDFMYALAHTKSPAQVNSKDYRAVHYIGGSNAMYGVADNKAIQDIVMSVYEDHNGIISSVCHGTAGIVNLKTKSGEYLVTGKKVSGYPDSFENQSKAYFKQFPFLIQQTIEQRGGTFIHAERNQAHVEVDGRIVTGQNHLSSRLVAEQIISMLKTQS